MSKQLKKMLMQILDCYEHIDANRRRVISVSKSPNKIGMWPAIPSIHWRQHQDKRNRCRQYMYMFFPWVNGKYSGPRGVQKVYIGCDKEKIRIAVAKKSNRELWEIHQRMIVRNARQLMDLFDEVRILLAKAEEEMNRAGDREEDE